MTPQQVRQIKRWLAQNGFAPEGRREAWLTNPGGATTGTAFQNAMAAASNVINSGFSEFLVSIGAGPPARGGSEQQQSGSGFQTPGGHQIGGGGFGGAEPVEGTSPSFPGETPDEEDTFEGLSQEEIDALLAEYESFLQDAGLPLSLLTTIEGWIRDRRSAAEINLLVRQTPEYLAAFPEMALRKENGLRPISEGEVLAYRDAARGILRTILGEEPTTDQIAQMLGNDWSISELEHRTVIEKRFRETDPRIFEAMELELGRQITDRERRAFLDPTLETAELQDVYEDILYRGRPVILGLGVRSEAEEQRLRNLGFDPDQAFEGYKRLASQLPSVERLAGLDQAIAGDKANPFDSVGALFESIFAEDPNTQQAILQMFARERARFRQGGGPAMTQGGVLAGLRTPDERSRL